MIAIFCLGFFFPTSKEIFISDLIKSNAKQQGTLFKDKCIHKGVHQPNSFSQLPLTEESAMPSERVSFVS